MNFPDWIPKELTKIYENEWKLVDIQVSREIDGAVLIKQQDNLLAAYFDGQLPNGMRIKGWKLMTQPMFNRWLQKDCADMDLRGLIDKVGFNVGIKLTKIPKDDGTSKLAG